MHGAIEIVRINGMLVLSGCPKEGFDCYDWLNLVTRSRDLDQHVLSWFRINFALVRSGCVLDLLLITLTVRKSLFSKGGKKSATFQLKASDCVRCDNMSNQAGSE